VITGSSTGPPCSHDDQGRLPPARQRVDAVKTPSSATPVDSSSHERDDFLITTEYYVNQAAVPLGVALFVCACGAKQVECDLHRDSAPEGWSIAPDGSAMCPRCAGANKSTKPES
jgi:hypothetical protein